MPQPDLYYEGTEHHFELNRAAQEGRLAFEIGLGGEARFVRDMASGLKLELIYWSEDEFRDEPELFQHIAIEAIKRGADIRRMTRDGKEV